MKERKPKRMPPRPASVEDGIRWLLDDVRWRVEQFYKVQGKGNVQEAKRWYNALFAYISCRRLGRLLLRKARTHTLQKGITIHIRIPIWAIQAIRLAKTPEDLVRIQNQLKKEREERWAREARGEG